MPQQMLQYWYFKKVQTEERTGLHLLTPYIRAPRVAVGDLNLVPSVDHSSNHVSSVPEEWHYL